MSMYGGSTHESQPRREIHFNLTAAQSNGKVSEANYDSPDEEKEKPQIQSKKVLKLRGESAKNNYNSRQSPIRRNNYLLAMDNNDKTKRPPNGMPKGPRTKEFPTYSTTFFKTPSGLTIGDKGFKFESNSKQQKQQRKLGQTYQKPNAFLIRSQSEKDTNRLKGMQRDPQDVAHSLHILKIQYNNITEDNTRFKTRNKNLEAVINTLYDDLNSQQQEIQKIYQGKQVTPAVFLTGSQLGLKRQLREERLINKTLSDDLECLKRSLKATTASEQAQQVQFYQEECIRLRSMLELEIRQNKQTAQTMIEDNVNVLTATTEEERKRILSELEKQNEELKFAHKQNLHLQSELDQARLKRHEAQRLKSMGDMQTRQAFLIKAKAQQIKTMEEQIQTLNAKVENSERIMQRNIDLTKQVTELNNKVSQRNNEIKTLKENSMNQSQTIKLPNLQSSPGKNTYSPVPALTRKHMKQKQSQPHIFSQQQNKQKTEESGQLLHVPVQSFSRQMSVPLEQRQKNQQARPKDDFEQHSNKPSFVMDTSPVQNLSSRPQSESTQFFKKIALSKSELCIRGLNNFKALAEKKEQPHNDIDQAFYKTYSKDIQQIYRKMQHQTLPLDVIKKLLDHRVIIPQGYDLQETVRICAEKFSVSANELQVCEVILNHFIPCITGDIFDATKFYQRLEILLNTHSENSMQSEETEGSIPEEQFIESDYADNQVAQFRSATSPVKAEIIDSHDRPPDVQILSLQEDLTQMDRPTKKYSSPTKQHPNQFPQQNQAYPSSDMQQEEIYPQVAESRTSEYSHPVDNFSHPINDFSGESMSGHSGNMIDQIANLNNSITEEQMLDTAEYILNTLAQNLIEKGWTVHDVFGQPDEIVRIIPEFENQRDIKVLSVSNFLGRVYQAGIQNLTELQVACLMRVLGKPEFEGGVRYDELELLLENFGVTKDQPSLMPDDNLDILQLEEEKVGDQFLQAGSPQNDSREISEEVVFIDDTKPVIEFPTVIADKVRVRTDESNTKKKQKTANGPFKDQPGYDTPTLIESKNVAPHGLPAPTSSVKRERLKSAAGLDHTQSRSDSVTGNTPTFVHLSAGPETSGVNTFKSNQLLGHSPVQAEDKDRNFTSSFDRKNWQAETVQKPLVSVTNQSYQVSEQKESRQNISRQILNNVAFERLASFSCEMHTKISFSELLVQIERSSYKQQIKSKTTFTETSVITLEALLAIIEPLSKIKLSPDEIKALQDCVQLTPKFSKIIAVKHFATFLKEVQELSLKNQRFGEESQHFGRRERSMDF